MWLFLFGAVVGPLCDLFHVTTQTTVYAHPDFLGLAWWVPPLFGSASVLIGIGHLVGLAKFHKSAPVPSLNQVILSVVWFVAIYFVSAFLKPEGNLKFATLALMALWVFWRYDRTRVGLGMAVLTAFGGCAFESFLGRLGVFYYSKPDFFGVAAWLPLVYVAASVAVGNMVRRFSCVSPKTLGLRHLALNVKNAQVSKKFYCDFFGMQLEWEPDPKNIFLTSQGQDNLALHERDDLPPEQITQALDHLGFVMRTKADVDIFRKRATDMNVAIAFETKQHRDGAYSFYIKDPDGYVVQVIYHPPISG